MHIYIVDLDAYFSDALARRLRAALPTCSVATFRCPTDLPVIDKASAEDPCLLVFTREQFEEFVPETPYLLLHDEPFHASHRQNEPKSGLMRLGPVARITEAILLYMQEQSVTQTSLKPVSTLISCGWDPQEQRYLQEALSNTQKSGVQTLLVELGPAVLFSAPLQPSRISASDFLVEVSLRKVRPETCGRYFETWPQNGLTLRLCLPSRSDDWVLSPASLLRDSLQLIEEWAVQQYKANWRLFLYCCALPFRLCRVAAAMSEQLVVNSSSAKLNKPLWLEEMSDLAGLLPTGSSYFDLAFADGQPSLSPALPQEGELYEHK